MAGIRYCARCVSVWLMLWCAGSIVQAAQSPSDCPLDFSALDFTSTVAACSNVSYVSCCDHSRALVAVAMSQYTRNTSNLHLPPDLLQPCMSFIGAVFEESDIQLPVATWCALNSSVLVDSPCQGITDVKSIYGSPNFTPVESSCGPIQSLVNSVSCQNCLNSQARFHGNLTNNRRISETWNSCAHTIFLSVASLGDSDFAMEHANCFFQLPAPNASFLPQSRCPVTLDPGQITSIAKSCNGSNGNRFQCCASALLELRISLTETSPMSETFSISKKQGAACIEDLDSALLTQAVAQDLHTEFQTCNISPEDIFHNSTHGCHGISTMEEIHSILLDKDVDYHLLHEHCSVPSTSCDQCRRTVLEAAFVVASTGSSEINSTVLQSCSDLVFLALARNSTKAKAIEIGSCLYYVPDIVDPAPPTEPPVPSSPIVVPSRVVPPFTRLIALLGICLVVMIPLLVILLIILVAILQCKGKALCTSEEMPLTGKARMKSRNFRKDGPTLFTHIRFSEIQRATDNFSTIIGRGGFGTVYKARFQDGLVAAVKRMNKGTSQGEQEFCKEMELLGRLHHRHLVTLRGYCAERHERFTISKTDVEYTGPARSNLILQSSENHSLEFNLSRTEKSNKLLVYEYCENGSLKEHLHHDGQEKQGLTWQRRKQIALDVATGLEYLHSFCEPPLCHRDIKSSNILLDENFTAKIADFGLAHAGRSGNAKFESITTEVHGTPGYMDPEYERTHELTEKSDVYSFGVLLLELVTARRAISGGIRLVDWAQKYMDNESKIPLIVDSDLENIYSLHELKSLITIIKRCTQSDGQLRPTMRQIGRHLYDLSPMMDSSSRPGNLSSPPATWDNLSSPEVDHDLLKHGLSSIESCISL